LSSKLPDGTVFQKLRKDYTLKLLPAGSFFTVQCDSAEGERVLACSIVQWYSGNEKLVDTGHRVDRRYLASVQLYEIWSRDGAEYPPQRLTVYSVGEPSDSLVYNMASSWGAFRSSLRRWAPRASDVEGCIDLVEPSVPSSGIDVLDTAAPTLLKLERLREAGWETRESLVVHTRDTRLIDVRSFRPGSRYLDVLLKWGDLPAVTNMRSDEPAAYYECLLAGHVVPGRKKAAWYRRILAGNAGDDASEAEEGGVVVAPPSGEGLSDEGDVSENVVEPADNVGASSASSSSSSSGSSTSSSDESEASSVVMEAAAAETFPVAIDGAPVHTEHRFGQYHRLIMVCQHHERCFKKRNTNLLNAPCADLGHWEAISYLAVWHQAGLGITREAHRGIKPSPASQRAWAAAHSHP
jgi:hypothetical protein